MEFESMEKAVYGDVETDEDLLAELYALEAEEKGKAAAKPVRGVPRVSAPMGKSKAGEPGGFGVSAQALSQALADADSDEMASDDDIDDPELLAEFSNLVDAEGDDEPIRAAPPQSAQTSTGSVNNELLQRLKILNQNYKALIEGSAGNAPKMRRYQRGLDKIQELTKKVQAGKAIDESEIPVEIPVPNSAARNAISSTPSPSEFRPPDLNFVTGAAPEIPARRPEVPRKPSTPIRDDFGQAEKVQPERASINLPREPAPELPKPPLPPRSTTAPTPASSHDVAPESSQNIQGNQIMQILKERRDAYLRNAQLANSANDKNAAFGFFTVVKQFDQAIALVNSGEVLECDEDELPPVPPPYKPPAAKVEIPQPKTVLEGLNQRLEKFRSICEQNKRDNDDRKYRMNSRIVQRYEEAVRAQTLKRPFDYSELPCPPGYPPLPLPKPSPAAASGVPSGNQQAKGPVVKPQKAHPAPPGAVASERGVAPQSQQQQQIQFLLKRQLQFKQAAVAAKQKKDIALAKKCLVSAKGFDSLIEAVRAGHPLDIKKVPVPPQVESAAAAVLQPAIVPQPIESDFEMVEGQREDIFATLEKDLIRQVKLCDENRIAFTKLGNVSRVTFFESLLRESKVDLLYLRQLAKSNGAVPKFRYETRDLPSINSCTDIHEGHLELTIMRVVDAKLPSGSHATLLCFAPYWRSSRRTRRNPVPSWKPSDGNIFVKYEFSFPHDHHQSGKTALVAGTNSPEFKAKVLLGIDRKSRQLLRVVKRNCLKFEVYQKGGFLRSDKLLGIADCKLPALEDKTQVHETVDLLEGRKPAGGKIEYKVRIREPLGEKKASMSREKWLVLVKSP